MGNSDLALSSHLRIKTAHRERGGSYKSKEANCGRPKSRTAACALWFTASVRNILSHWQAVCITVTGLVCRELVAATVVCLAPNTQVRVDITKAAYSACPPFVHGQSGLPQATAVKSTDPFHADVARGIPTTHARTGPPTVPLRIRTA